MLDHESNSSTVRGALITLYYLGADKVEVQVGSTAAHLLCPCGVVWPVRASHP